MIVTHFIKTLLGQVPTKLSLCWPINSCRPAGDWVELAPDKKTSYTKLEWSNSRKDWHISFGWYFSKDVSLEGPPNQSTQPPFSYDLKKLAT